MFRITNFNLRSLSEYVTTLDVHVAGVVLHTSIHHALRRLVRAQPNRLLRVLLVLHEVLFLLFQV